VVLLPVPLQEQEIIRQHKLARSFGQGVIGNLFSLLTGSGTFFVITIPKYGSRRVSTLRKDFAEAVFSRMFVVCLVRN
jgi:hypothetical protein